ncbi:hypothetical protein [Ammoniphilus sp. YIM 78166]|uniref:hypothetical protein n=1 Tax=Ammoniphilus sp. YIM 78166 TaxID=1644106 RepID=UPI001430A63F|nr:hypothetical protein [Ammoniphilus sp. YIM 78166]
MSVGTEYEEEVRRGHGIFYLVNKGGQRKTVLLNCELDTKLLEEYRMEFFGQDTNQEESYLVSVKDNVFITHLGNAPEKFNLSFNEHKEQMRTKYGDDEFIDVIVPID